MRAIDFLYGDKVVIEYIMGGLIEDISTLYDIQAPQDEVIRRANAIIAKNWVAASKQHGMPVVVDNFQLFTQRYPSSYPQNVAYEAAKRINAQLAKRFLRLMREKSAIVELDAKLTQRAVNEGFSGGEKKKNEIFQMAMLDPKLAILDETDSGLDIDALRIVATGVTRLKREDNATVVITHYQRLLDYIVPDYVHVLYKGRIIYTGDKTLALKLEKEGYDWLINDYKEE